MGLSDVKDDEVNSPAPSVNSNRSIRSKAKSLSTPRLPLLRDHPRSSMLRSISDTPRIADLQERGKISGSAGRNFGRRKTNSLGLTQQNDKSTAESEGPTPYQRFRLKARAVKWLCYICIVYRREASDRALKGSLLELVEEILCSAEEESKRTGSEGGSRKGLVSSSYPDVTFDPSQFQRFSKREEGLPNKVKELLRSPIEDRTKEQIQNIVRHMQGVEEFAKFPPELQKRLCKYAWYEKIGRNRVVTKDGQIADGIYFVLSGKLTETCGGQSYILNKGDKFGESDIIQRKRRTSTVLTRNPVELFCVHAEDYALVCDTELNIKEEACIEYLRTIPVFNAWSGLNNLLDSPSYWGKQNYRAGQVIVTDSSVNEWIYVIKAGTCDVLKIITPGYCTSDETKRLLREYKKAKCAREMTLAHKEHALSQPKLIHYEEDVVPPTSGGVQPRKIRQPMSGVSSAALDNRRTLQRDMSTNNGQEVPYCVRVGILEAGDVFDILSINSVEEDSVVSLVSQGAEAIRISKSFFMKYADERVFTQIEMRYEGYPTQAECLYDLEQTDRWQRYKKQELERTVAKVEENAKIRESLRI